MYVDELNATGRIITALLREGNVEAAAHYCQVSSNRFTGDVKVKLLEMALWGYAHLFAGERN